MALPFDVANFNLTNFANAYNDIFDSEAKNVDIQVKDENGNITTKTVANRGTFKQQLWDDVGGALGQFSRTFYVDAENGDDNNDGSSNNPFKTLRKAIDSVPVGGMANIYLCGDQDHILASNVCVYHKYIHFDAYDFDNDTQPVIANIIPNTDDNYTTGFICKDTILDFYNVSLKTAAYSDDNTDAGRWEGLFRRFDFTSMKLLFMYSNIEINDTPLIRIAAGPSSALDVYFYNCSTVQQGENRATTLIYNENGNILFGYYGGNVNDKDGNDISVTTLVTGVVKDADSGNPINLISNINFSD